MEALVSLSDYWAAMDKGPNKETGVGQETLHMYIHCIIYKYKLADNFFSSFKYYKPLKMLIFHKKYILSGNGNG